MKSKLRLCLATALASVCLAGFNAAGAGITVPGTYKNITIDGSFLDWAGVPLATNAPLWAGASIQLKNLYVANDDNYLYIRFSSYNPTNPFTTSKQNVFFDCDNSAAKGYSAHGIGSEVLIEGGIGYAETNGVFSGIGGILNLGWSLAPAGIVSEWEFRVSRNATYTNGLPIFTNNTIALFIESSSEPSGNEWFPNITGGLVYTFATAPSVLTTNLPLVGLSSTFWQYSDTGTDFSTNWLDSAYDDSSWTRGAGLFGYTSTPGSYPTLHTPLSTSPNTYYYRTHFTWGYQTANIALVVTNYLSDGAVYYINGTEVKRVRMPAGDVAYVTAATATNSSVGQPEVFGISAGPLQIGDNLLEVETHQAPLSSSDMVFGLSLTAAAQFAPMVVDATLPANQTVTAGQPVTFTSDVLGSSLSYQWFKDGVAIASATAPILTIPLVLTNDAGSYSLSISNALGTNVTRAALLTVLSTPVVINDTTQPADQYVVEGRSVTFNVVASGSALVTYQWYQGANPIAGATGASYSIPSVAPANAGSYYVVVSNPASTTNSRTAALTVLRDTIPPAVSAITASGQRIVLTFSEPVDATTANNPAHYVLSGGGSVSSAVINPANPMQVTLTTSSPFTLGTVCSLTVSGVNDLFGNPANSTVSFAPTITIDGNFNDWQGVDPVYSGPIGSDGAADFKDIYVYNDANNYYFRVTLWHDIPPANGFFPKYVDMFFDTDIDPSTGYSAVGSDLMIQSSIGYQQKNGGFNEGSITGLGLVCLPAAAGTNFEFSVSRTATFTTDGTLVFPTNGLNFLWMGQTPGFVALNYAPWDGGVISYTNVDLAVPTLPLGQLAVFNVGGGNVGVVWDAPGTLQYCTSLPSSSWTTLPTATSPYIVPASAGPRFFRLTR